MNQRQKILFVLPFNPYPLSTGGSQAIFNGIDVVKDDLEVYVTFEATPQDAMLSTNRWNVRYDTVFA